MSFENDKKNALTKLDKSKKGYIDEKIKPLLDKINSMNDYYTTSSCSGRIMVYEPNEKKNEVKWLYVTHDAIRADDIQKHKTQSSWLKMTGVILHIACRTIDGAEEMLNFLREQGYKRTGIISTKKFIIELMGTEHLDTPLKSTNEEYVQILAQNTNKLLNKAHKKLDLLCTNIKYIKQ